MRYNGVHTKLYISIICLVYSVGKMNPDAPDPQEPSCRSRKKRELTAQQRQDVVDRLLPELQGNSDKQKFPKGVLSAVAAEFKVCPTTIRRIWRRALSNFKDPAVNRYCSDPLKNKCGRRQKWNRVEVREALKEIPVCEKRSIRSLAHALCIPKSTLFQMKGLDNDAVVMAVSTASKPILTEEHKSQSVDSVLCGNKDLQF